MYDPTRIEDFIEFLVDLGMWQEAAEMLVCVLDLRISTPQIIINYACLLEENKYFEDAFRLYERGVKIFKYPHVKDLWMTYLTKFIKRYGKSKLERARELFEHAIEMAPADAVKPLYLQYAKLEEDYGLAKRAMKVYDQATKAVPNSEKLAMYEIYVTRTLEMFGVPKAREIYEQAIQSGLPDKDVKTLCLNYAEIEKRMGEIDRARGIYCFSAQFADPRIDQDFWNKWREFEVQHGNEDTYRDMLHLKRTVVASHSQSHFILSEYLMQKDQKLDINEAKEKLKQAEICIDGMADLERHLAPIATGPTPTDDKREVGFVSAGLQVQTDDGLKLNANEEDIELPEEIESEDERVEISQRKVPAAVFGVLDQMGGLERIKRQRRS